MYKLVVYVPVDYAERVKCAMFSSGAGRIGKYDRCCWQVLGLGQFRPLEGSQPFSGEIGDICHEEEFRVELVCEDQYIKEVLSSMKRVHPYETPAFDVWRLADVESLP